MVNSHLATSVRPHISSTGEDEQDIAGNSGRAKEVRGTGNAGNDEVEDDLLAEIMENEVAPALNPRMARRPDAPTKAMIQAH